MGMYTQVRGWLNIDSIGYGDERLIKAEKLLEQAKEDFENDNTLVDYDGDKLARKWVCHNTTLVEGGNGSLFLFFGTELKNYGNPAKAWIEYLIKYFPNAEGRIDFQCEEEERWEDVNLDIDNNNLTRSQLECSIGGQSNYILIYKGKIIKDDYCRTWCKGYGNCGKYLK